MVFHSALTLAISVLVVVLACFNSWDQFFFTFFKTFQSLGLGVRVSMIRVSVRVTVKCLVCFYQAYTALSSFVTLTLQI